MPIIAGIIAAILVFLALRFAGRDEPTHHGQIIITQIALVFGAVAGVVVGLAVWIF